MQRETGKTDGQEVLALYNGLDEGPARETLRQLMFFAKKKAGRFYLLELENKRGLIAGKLASDDAKTRKNAAIVLGELGEGFCPALISALENESTEFVLPSLILALGKTKTDEAKKFLAAYEPRAVVEKHRLEEERSLRLALGGFEKAKVLSPNVAWQKIALTAMRDHCALLKEELEALDIPFADHQALSDCVVVSLERYSTLNKIRTYMEALIELGRCKNNPVSIRNYFKKELFAKKLGEIFGPGKLPFRLEIGGDKLTAEERSGLMELALGSIGAPNLVNNPSAYSFELRLMVKGEGVYVFAKASDELDTRFSYRKNCLSASINPVAAAVMMRYLYPYLKRDASVIDPFCGTGTMLIERAKVKSYKLLHGVDIRRESVDMARENESIAKTGAKFLHADILKFEPRAKYDECVANMPFGLRVSTHAGNESLYDAFLDRLPSLLIPGGRAFLYTNDKRLLRQLIESKSGLKLLDEMVFASGNIHASLFTLAVENEKRR